MDPTTSQYSLSNLLSGRLNQPALWSCPLQEGIPAFLNLALDILLWGAAIAFFIGILLSVYYYMTAFGDENKASSGLKTLKFTFIGAAVVIISALVINSVITLLANTGNASYTKTSTGFGFVLRNQDGDEIKPTTNCTEQSANNKPSSATEVDPGVQQKAATQAENDLNAETQLQDSGLEEDTAPLFKTNSGGSIQS